MRKLKHLFIIILFLILACSKEEDETYNHIIYQSLPTNFTICPDTISSSLDYCEIKFDFASPDGCHKYYEHKIISDQNNTIRVKLYGKEIINLNIGCLSAVFYSYPSIKINIVNRSKFAVQFLNDNDEVAITRNVVVSNNHNNNFIFKLINDIINYATVFNHKIVLHDQNRIENSSFTDTIVLSVTDTVKVIIQNIPEMYNKLFYTYLECDTIYNNCFPIIGNGYNFSDNDSNIFYIDRGIPEVIMAHVIFFYGKANYLI